MVNHSLHAQDFFHALDNVRRRRHSLPGQSLISSHEIEESLGPESSRRRSKEAQEQRAKLLASLFSSGRTMANLSN
jgi:hypothetical protein